MPKKEDLLRQYFLEQQQDQPGDGIAIFFICLCALIVISSCLLKLVW